MQFARQFFDEAGRICETIDTAQIERLAHRLAQVRERGGRVFFFGVGGSAGNCSHAVCDFRKLCGLEAYAPTDNPSELTARINDEGWDTVFAAWLAGSRASSLDAVFVLSVGGGDVERNISRNLVYGVQEAKRRGLEVFGVIGREEGFTAQMGDCVLVVPAVAPSRITPLTESFQALVWHCLVSHPALQIAPTKWESAAPPPAAERGAP